MIRKIVLSHWLMNDNWKTIRADLDKRPVEGINGKSSNSEIKDKLAKYGIHSDKVVLWGTGKPLREFLWSEEMADACVYIMERVDFKDTIPEGNEIRNCHINIGTGKEVTITGLAQIIVETVGYKGKISFDSSKPDGTMRKLTNPSKLHELGWHHKIDIEEGVGKLYHWYINSIS